MAFILGVGKWVFPYTIWAWREIHRFPVPFSCHGFPPAHSSFSQHGHGSQKLKKNNTKMQYLFKRTSFIETNAPLLKCVAKISLMWNERIDTVVCKKVQKIGLYVVKLTQEKQACHSHDGATPLSFWLQVSEDFFLNLKVFFIKEK